MFRAAPPAEILAHTGFDQLLPDFGGTVVVDGALHGFPQRRGRGSVEAETGGGVIRQGKLRCIDDRVGQAAGAAHDGNGSITQAVDLVQTARFET